MGLPYHSAHKFRHGHAVYGIKNSKDIGDLKTVSMNLMHSNLSITDGVYGVLSTLEVSKRILELGNHTSIETISQIDIANQLINLGNVLKKNHV